MIDRYSLPRSERNAYIEKFIKMIWIDETSLTDFEYLHLCSALSEISRVHESLCDRANDNKGV